MNGSRGRVAVVAVAATLAGGAGARQQPHQPPRFSERVDVARVIIDARVLDDYGNPILGLTPEDFRVRIDGKPVRVETAAWIGGTDAAAASATARAGSAAPAGALDRAGRLVVLLFQKDLDPSRIVGLMRMLLKSRNFLDTLAPNDRVAILSFDSHLKIWTDLTNDRETLDRVLARGVLFERPGAIQSRSKPSLLERLDPGRSRRAYTIERALELIGEALEPLPGSKSLVLVGYGFGRFGREGVTVERDYGPARAALVASRTSVFSLDVTDADHHSLEAGLQLVSEQTGGFYERTHLFADRAMRRLSGALAGYYVLFVERPETLRTGHEVSVEIAGKGRVFAASGYWDKRR